MKGNVQTVLGLIEPGFLGLTLTHEHLLHDLSKNVFTHPKPSIIPTRFHAQDPMSLEHLCWTRQYPYCFTENLEFADEDTSIAVKEEMHFFKESGGSAVVDNGSIGLRTKNHAHYLKSLSEKTGVHIITGTGYYVVYSQSASVKSMTVEEMATKTRDDILKGIDGSDVKCGVIGEIGCSWPLDDFERRSLISAAIVQSETGAPVIIHPGRDKKSPEEIIRIFAEAGGKIGHTVMSHLDRTLLTKQDLAEFASLGSYCEFDLFGTEVSHYQHNEAIDMPSDGQRIKRIRYLVDQGYSDKILVAHDIHTKHRLMKFGGHGFSHIITSVLPKMAKRDFRVETIKKIMYENPKTWLTFE